MPSSNTSTRKLSPRRSGNIFILDEVLAVGDVTFQTRCFDRIDQLRKVGKTIVLISHDLAAIERICDRAVLLNRGELIMTGSPRDVVEEYSRSAYSGLVSIESAVAKLCEIRFAGVVDRSIRTGDPMTAKVYFEIGKPIHNAIVTMSFYWPSGYLCTQMVSSDGRNQEVCNGSVLFDFSCPILTMQRGLYRVDIPLQQGNEVLGYWRCCTLLRVDPGKIIIGDFYLSHSCTMRSISR